MGIIIIITFLFRAPVFLASGLLRQLRSERNGLLSSFTQKNDGAASARSRRR